MTRKILLTGARGQLGRAILARLSGRWEVHPFSRQALDIARAPAVAAVVGSLRPDWIVNCAAWTDVDGAEADPAGAHDINDAALGGLADAASAAACRLLHFSSDYVFDGRSGRPYVESDAPAPLNVYGASKLAGERRLLAHPVEAAILRTSWLYGEDGHNFLLTVLRLAAERRPGDPPLEVVDDQLGTPTDVHSLAAGVEIVLEEDLRGLFHASCQGQSSWYAFARAIFDLAGVRVAVKPVPTAAHPRPARRPAYSVLANRRLEELGRDRFPPWEEGLRRVLERLPGSPS